MEQRVIRHRHGAILDPGGQIAGRE
jgi:hypothetical protein